MTLARVLTDADGNSWQVKLVSHGRTSDYLNLRIQRPVLQLTCLSERRPHRYALLPPSTESIEDLKEAALVALLGRSRPH
jgi:hypothetical protein